jgi:hypothetical protein
LPGSGVQTVGRNGFFCSPAAITDYQAIDRIIAHLKLTFVAAKPPPSHVFEQVALPAAEESGEYC